MRKKITIKDVAKLAKVSISTVSRVLSNPEMVKADKREAVLKVVEELNFIPNLSAQSMNKSLKNIGVILSRTAEDSFLSPYLSDVLRGIVKIAKENEYFIQLLTYGRNSKNARILTSMYKSGRIDGFILLSSKVDDIFIREFIKEKVPFILNGSVLDEKSIEHVYTVDIDNVEASKLMVNYLAKLGHKKVAFVNSSTEYVVNYERELGYKLGLEESGLKFEKKLVFEVSEDLDEMKSQIIKLLINHKDITAIFCKNDIKARQVINVAEELGIKVPEQLSVAGFNNTYVATMAKPRITTIDVPVYEMGKQLTESFIQILNGNEIERHQQFNTNLLIMDSCTNSQK